jgi:glycosyltransferase involved in cell wall biosynthesis
LKDRPLASVIINNYNYGHFLPEAIESSLNQTYAPLETIVVDDGSTDNSREILSQYGDRLVSVLKQNGGQASAFNAGFAASHGDIICFLDADDIYLPEKVASIVTVFQQFPNVDWCFHNQKGLNTVTGEFVPLISKDMDSQICDYRTQMARGKLPHAGPATSSLCFRRSLLEQILPMPEAIAITSDNYLKFATFALSEGFFLGESLAVRKVHGDNRYTARRDREFLILRSNIDMLTAYWLRINWPMLAKFSNQLFSKGLGLAWQAREKGDKDSLQVIQCYFSAISTLEELRIRLRTLLRNLKKSLPTVQFASISRVSEFQMGKARR